MWNVILVIEMVVFLFFVYHLFGKDFVNASFFMTAGFVLSSIFALLSMDDWDIYIAPFTVVIILTGLIAFFVGDMAGSQVRFTLRKERGISKERDQQENQITYIKIRPLCVLVASLFMVITDVYYFKFIYNLSLQMGNRFGVNGMFQYARYAIVNANYDSSLPTLLGHAQIITECLGYIFLMVVIYNIIMSKKIISLNIFPIILYIVNAGISTARFNFLKFFIAGIIMILVILIKHEKKFRRFKFKTLVIGILGFIILLWAFRMLGYLTGKSAARELWSDISVYVGSSIAAFDVYLKNPYEKSDIFGKETLYNVYKMLRSFNLTDVPVYNVTLPFIRLANGRGTNVYTAFESLIQDYGYGAMHVILFFEGLFYGTFTNSIKNSKYIDISTIIFAYMFYPVVFSCIEEKFILNFTAINLVYHIVYFVILYKILIGTRIYVVNQEMH